MLKSRRWILILGCVVMEIFVRVEMRRWIAFLKVILSYFIMDRIG